MPDLLWYVPTGHIIRRTIFNYNPGIFSSIITHLETLKTEAADIARKVEETDVVMAEVETVSQQYGPLAQSCSGIYFTLESLNQVWKSDLYYQQEDKFTWLL